MTAKSLATVTTDLINAYGNATQHVINANRTGGERIVDTVEKRWEVALAATGPKWTDEARRQALAAQRLLGGYCARSISLTTMGADTLVQHVVRLATGAVDQTAANASRFEAQTGFSSLNPLAIPAAPAAQAASEIARQFELKAAELASRLAQENGESEAKRVTPFRKARTANKAP